MTVTDAAGDASQYFFDENGLLVKTVDPLGNVTFATYDSNGNLTSLTGPTGLTTSYHTTPRETSSVARTRSGRPLSTRTPEPTTCCRA